MALLAFLLPVFLMGIHSAISPSLIAYRGCGKLENWLLNPALMGETPAE
jgi:hypothetical protein